jgi:hypothetical protein
MTIRITCPDCQQPVGMSAWGRVYKHGDCPRSGRPVGRLWPAKHQGRRVQTLPGPDTETLTQGVA